MGQTLKNLRSFLLDTLQTVVLALSVFMIIYLFLFQPHQVKGVSMYPNFQDSEYLLTDKISYRFHKPERGDVVVFPAPRRPSQDFIKRIIGLPQEKVSIKGGKVYINQRPLNEKYLPFGTITQARSFPAEDGELTLGQNEYFVMGDNRENSSDSREWGTITGDKIVGKAWVVYWPPARVGLLPQVSY